MRELKIVLKESVSNDDISLYAWQNDWSLYEVSPRTEKTPLTKIWMTSDEQTGIHYFEDFYINNKYLLLGGQNKERIATEIRSSLNTYSLKDILQKLQKQNEIVKDEYINTVLSLGVAINREYDLELFNVFRELMSNPDSDIREAAIFTTTYLGWKEFYEPLQWLKNEDTSSSVREFASLSLASLEKNYWQEETEEKEESEKTESKGLEQLKQELKSNAAETNRTENSTKKSRGTN